MVVRPVYVLCFQSYLFCYLLFCVVFNFLLESCLRCIYIYVYFLIEFFVLCQFDCIVIEVICHLSFTTFKYLPLHRYELITNKILDVFYRLKKMSYIRNISRH